MTSFGYIASTAKNVLEKLFPDSIARRRRIQALVVEVEDMVSTFLPRRFGQMFRCVVTGEVLLSFGLWFILQPGRRSKRFAARRTDSCIYNTEKTSWLLNGSPFGPDNACDR